MSNSSVSAGLWSEIVVLCAPTLTQRVQGHIVFVVDPVGVCDNVGVSFFVCACEPSVGWILT